MTNAVKGVLLSALVFPGLGQIALKRSQRGVAFVLATLTLLLIAIALCWVYAAVDAYRIGKQQDLPR